MDFICLIAPAIACSLICIDNSSRNPLNPSFSTRAFTNFSLLADSPDTPPISKGSPLPAYTFLASPLTSGVVNFPSLDFIDLPAALANLFKSS